MKRFKPMICPICGGMYFSEPNKGDLYEDEINEYLEGEVHCRHCGWIFDLDQFENPSSHDGFNKLSLEEYKIMYIEKIKDNPKYDYLEENKPKPVPHKCPVCGEFEFEDEDSYEICPVCGWEDDGYYEGGGANDASLEDAQKAFKSKRFNNPKYKWENDNKSRKN